MDNNSQQNKAAQPRQWVERSRKPDWVLRSVTVIALVGWVTAMAALALYYLGAPKNSGIGETLNAIRPNIGAGASSGTNAGLLTWAFIAVVASCVVCAAGFILNVTRHKRKTDRFNRLLIVLSAVSVAFLAVILINYSGVLFS